MMNERLKELEEQCWVQVPCDFDMDAGGLSTVRTVFDRKKFAELIVRECIDVFSKDLPDSTSPDYQLGSLPEVVNRVCNVAEHFGVEE